MSLSVNFNTHSQSLTSAYRDVRDGEINKWVIYGYDKGGNDLKVLGNGDGGLDELQEEFNDGKIQYAYVKVEDPNSELPKIVLIGWCGESVPEAKKGLFNSHLNEVSNFLKGYHLQINARTESDVEPSYIMKRIEKSGGSKYSINVDKNAPPPKPEPILPVRSVYKPVQIPNITEIQRNAPRERIEPVRSVYEPVKVPVMNELRQSAAQEKFEPVKSSYQPVQVPDISELQRSAHQEKIGPVRSAYQPVKPPKPKPINSARLAFLNTGKETEPENTYRKDREEHERAERDKAKREEQERLRQEREMAEREERERAEREERERAKREEQERLRQEREMAEREERERKRLERERAEREEQEREQFEREEWEREQLERERAEQEERERTEQLRREREEQKRLDEEKQRAEKERMRRQREEEEELLRKERLKLEEEELLRQQELASAEATETQTLSARVLYPYDAAEDNEMSLTEGEIIVNISQIDDGWWQGESKDGSRYGLFPANYVESIEGETELTTETYEQDEPEPEPQHEHVQTAGKSAKALYDYDAGEDNEISFKEDDIINDIEFVSDDWWQGTSPDGVIGLFPANYVELI